MTHTLMHKDLPVADLDFDHATGSIGKIGMIHHGSHLPVGVPLRKGMTDRAAHNEWWEDRSVLSDHYWIKPAGSKLTLRDVNFF